MEEYLSGEKNTVIPRRQSAIEPTAGLDRAGGGGKIRATIEVYLFLAKMFSE